MDLLIMAGHWKHVEIFHKVGSGYPMNLSFTLFMRIQIRFQSD